MARRLNSKFPRAPRACRPRTYSPSKEQTVSGLIGLTPIEPVSVHFTKLQNGRRDASHAARSASQVPFHPPHDVIPSASDRPSGKVSTLSEGICFSLDLTFRPHICPPTV